MVVASRAAALPRTGHRPGAAWGIALSVAAHAMLMLLLWPGLGGHAGPSPAPGEQAVLTVELVSRPDAIRGQPSTAATPAAPVTPPPAAAGGDAPAMPAAVAPARPADPAVNLGDSDSDSEALTVTSNLHAGLDPRYHNQPPGYPREASRLGQDGTVRLIVHVTPAGLAGLVELVESSGSASLDGASRDAVEKWHFTPATRDGAAVESIYPVMFNFRKANR